MHQPPYPQHLPPPRPPVPTRVAQAVLWVQGGLGVLASLLVLAGAVNNVRGMELAGRSPAYAAGTLGGAILFPVAVSAIACAALLCAARLQPGRPGARRGALILEGAATALGVLALLAVMATAVAVDDPSIFFAAVPLLIATAIPGTALGCLLSPAARAYSHGLPPVPPSVHGR